MTKRRVILPPGWFANTLAFSQLNICLHYQHTYRHPLTVYTHLLTAMSSDYEFSDNEYYDEDEDGMLEDDDGEQP